MPGPFLRPVDAAISASYDSHRNRKPPSSNPGTDFRCAMRTPVRAPMDSVVIRVDRIDRTPQGKHIWLRDVRDGAELQMMHFDEPQVNAGQRLDAGEQIGLSGNTGNSTGPHLHTSLWFQGRTLDFMDYVVATPAGGGSATPAGGGSATPAAPVVTPSQEEEEMKPFVAILPNGRWVLVVPQGNAKPRAVTLQGNAGTNAVALYGQPIPFDQEIGAKSLALAVDGV